MQSPNQYNKLMAAFLAFFLGIVGADFFYRRKFSGGFTVFFILILGYVLPPLMQQSMPESVGLLRQIPTILVLYGWVRAFLYATKKSRLGMVDETNSKGF